MKSIQSPPQGSLNIPAERPVDAAWALVVVWLIGTTAGLWHFELQNFQAFSTLPAESFEVRARPQLERWYRDSVRADSSASLTVVHVYREGCRCNDSAQSQLSRLIDQYRARGVRFLAATLPASAASSAAPRGTQWAADHISLPDNAGIHAGPAALIFDQSGRLMYYGPYSDSAWCGGSGLLLDRALEDALTGQAPRTGSAARGCFCTG